MATVKRKTTVSVRADQIWASLIGNPSRSASWLTPFRGLEEKVTPPVRHGVRFGARIGNLIGKIRVVDAVRGRKLRWKVGPGRLLAMGMGMKGTLWFHPLSDGSTRVQLTMELPPMGPLMRMRTGLNPKGERTRTIECIKARGSPDAAARSPP